MAKFQKGQSGNPSGKKTGTGYRQQLQALLVSRKDELVDVAINLALNGNETMLKVCLDRLLFRPTDMPLENMGTMDGSLSQQGNQVLGLIASGDLTPSEGTTLLHGLTAQAKLVETTELADKVEIINSTLKTRKRVKHES